MRFTLRSGSPRLEGERCRTVAENPRTWEVGAQAAAPGLRSGRRGQAEACETRGRGACLTPPPPLSERGGGTSGRLGAEPGPGEAQLGDRPWRGRAVPASPCVGGTSVPPSPQDPHLCPPPTSGCSASGSQVQGRRCRERAWTDLPAGLGCGQPSGARSWQTGTGQKEQVTRRVTTDPWPGGPRLPLTRERPAEAEGLVQAGDLQPQDLEGGGRSRASAKAGGRPRREAGGGGRPPEGFQGLQAQPAPGPAGEATPRLPFARKLSLSAHGHPGGQLLSLRSRPCWVVQGLPTPPAEGSRAGNPIPGTAIRASRKALPAAGLPSRVQWAELWAFRALSKYQQLEPRGLACSTGFYGLRPPAQASLARLHAAVHRQQQGRLCAAGQWRQLGIGAGLQGQAPSSWGRALGTGWPHLC